MEDSSILYHASTIRNLTELIPYPILSNGKDVGSYLFATKDIKVAAMFLAPRDGGTININIFDDEAYAVIKNSPEAFAKFDVGGSIYMLPPNGFQSSQFIESAGMELVSTQSVKPISEQAYASSLDAMLEMGVKVYFLTDEKFLKVQAAKDHGFEILSNNKPYRPN